MVAAADAFGRPGLMDDGLDAIDHPAADEGPRQRVGCLHGAGGEARQRRGGVVAVDGVERAAVAGVERLEQVGGLGPADLADEDMVGPVAQGVAHQVADGDAAVAEPPRLEAQAVGAAQPQRQGVLYRDDAAFGRQQ